MRKLLIALCALPLGWGAHSLWSSIDKPVATAIPAPVVVPRVIELAGGSNFRDIGGYRTEDGRQVRSGLVYRSASTDQFTTGDFEKLIKLNIRMFCDLRDARERVPKRPDGVAVPPIQTWPDVQTGTIDVSTPEAAYKAILGGYERMPMDYTQQMGDIYRHIARGELPLLYNCSAGKDRTGVTTAILLRILGVPQEVVIGDYLASNHLLDMKRVQGKASTERVLGQRAVSPEAMKILASVQPEWIKAAFASIDEHYGSFDNYLRAGLGLSDDEIAAIRNRLLE